MISVTDREPPVDDTADPRLREAIGRNADYYLRRWREMDARRSTRSWNWPACLLNLYWFAWRKMWGPLALLLVAFVLLGVAGAAGPRAGQVTFLASIGLSFITGAFGNHLYRRKCRRLVEASSDMEAPAAQAYRSRHGGVSNLALAIALVVSLALGALSVMGMMKQQQQQQEQQAEALEAVAEACPLWRTRWLA